MKNAYLQGAGGLVTVVEEVIIQLLAGIAGSGQCSSQYPGGIDSHSPYRVLEQSGQGLFKAVSQLLG
jgi:hypothetical protein